MYFKIKTTPNFHKPCQSNGPKAAKWQSGKIITKHKCNCPFRPQAAATPRLKNPIFAFHDFPKHDTANPQPH